MPNFLKRISSFLILFVISLILIPNNVFALSTGYKNINEDIVAINDDNSSVQFSKVSFKNWSDSEHPTFGLAGLVYNGNNYDISFVATANFYDLNYNLIATTYSNQFVPSGEYNSYSQISNLDEIKSGYTANDIAYYKLDVEISKSGTSTTTNNNSQYSNYDYILNSYDINMIVNENNTFKITEKIGVYFNIDKHGIFRKIPLKNVVTRLDGTTSKNRAKISDINVSDNYSLHNENGYKVIKIGDANHTITGQKNYTISYLYNLGKDTGKEYDELYFNLIGDEWDTSISNITFTITMPKEFDKSKLGFSSGIKGSTDGSNVIFDVSGNVITGKLNGTLNPGEALTVRLELPEGYFVGASNNFDFMMIISIIFPILFVLIGYLLWKKYGKDEQVIETVEFYPPQGFNSLEVGFLYKGKAENQDVTSLLVYLANQGYIKISEFEEKSLFSSSQGFKITKLKEYDGNNINEQVFLNGLFTKRPTISLFGSNDDASNNPNEVTSVDLYNNFYITMNKILSNINNKENKHKIFEKAASSKTIFIVLMIIATYCLITIPPIFAYGELSTLLFALLFPGIGFTVMFKMLFGETQTIYVNGKPTHSSIGTKLFGLVWGGMFGGMPWAFMVLPALLEDYIYLVIYIIGLLCVLGLIICLKYLPKRTLYGNQILGKLKGFKNFLETAEKDKLEAMVMQDPSYFYNILPYTYVLGVSDKWIKKFETISLQAPSWYDSPTGFNVVTFGSFMNNTMTSAQKSMSSSPSSSSGGSSGGGSSGGGSGGGGGGSW